MVKPFSSHKAQIDILRARKLGVTEEEYDSVLEILKKENYYNVINGYKLPFLNMDKTIETGEDCFIEETSFFEVHSVFLFDREIRNLFLRSLLVFESHFKSAVSYRFSENFKEINNYLNEQNYIKDTTKLEEIKKLIKISQSIIDDKKEKKYHSIKHYFDCHEGNVPLWVLVNDYTFGNISVFYSLLDDRLRNTIARDFSNYYQKEHGNSARITAKILGSVARTSTHFRNCCAHEMTLYNSAYDQRAATKEISTELRVEKKFFEKNGLFSLYLQLKLVLPKEEHDNLKNSLIFLLSKLEDSINENSYKKIVGIMGFPEEWYNLSE